MKGSHLVWMSMFSMLGLIKQLASVPRLSRTNNCEDNSLVYPYFSPPCSPTSFVFILMLCVAYPASSEDHQSQCEELEQGVSELRKLLQEATQQYGALERAKEQQAKVRLIMYTPVRRPWDSQGTASKGQAYYAHASTAPLRKPRNCRQRSCLLCTRQYGALERAKELQAKVRHTHTQQNGAIKSAKEQQASVRHTHAQQNGAIKSVKERQARVRHTHAQQNGAIKSAKEQQARVMQTRAL